MTLMELTDHEAGIIVYNNNAVGVFNWSFMGDNEIPYYFCGSNVGFPLDNVFSGVKKRRVKDLRRQLPGSCWIDDGELVTDMDIIQDNNNDLPLIFGLVPDDHNVYTGDEGYGADVYRLTNGMKIICPLLWC